MKDAINQETLMAGIDLRVTFRAVVGTDPGQEGDLDGENMLSAISGPAAPYRAGSLSWLHLPDWSSYNGYNHLDLAIRMGNFKLLMDVDGFGLQFCNVVKDEAESNDLAGIQ